MITPQRSCNFGARDVFYVYGKNINLVYFPALMWNVGDEERSVRPPTPHPLLFYQVLDIAEARSASSRSTASSRKTRHEETYESDSLSDHSFTKLFEEFEELARDGSRSQSHGSSYNAWGRPEDWHGTELRTIRDPVPQTGR